MSNPKLIVNYVADAAILVNRLVKMGTGDRAVTTAVANTDFIIGVVNEVAPAVGERVDVVRDGIAWVEAGAAIPRGSPLTCDGVGRAIVSAPGAGVNHRIIGFAEETAGAAGDVIRFILGPSYYQG
jgi:hypothetical protein